MIFDTVVRFCGSIRAAMPFGVAVCVGIFIGADLPVRASAQGVPGNATSQAACVTSSVLAQQPANAALPPHAPGIIVFKLKDDAAVAMNAAVQRGAAVGPSLPPGLQSLYARHGLRETAPVFPGHSNQVARLTRAAQSQATATLTALEQRLLDRQKRAPARASVPALERVFRVTVPGADADYKDALNALRASPDVEYAEPSTLIHTFAVMPNDPQFSKQWALHNTGQVYPANGYNLPPGTPDCDIDAPEAWEITTGSESLVIAVVDTGVDYNHRDLVNNIWENLAEKNGFAGVDDDGNGFTDDIRGYDFTQYGQSRDNDPADPNGHGTHCAGIIAAEGNNGLDICGVLWKAKIMALKSMNAAGTGYTDDAAAAIRYAVDNGADIASLSLGDSYNSNVLRDAVAYAESRGLLLVAAAGNDGVDGMFYPAFYDTVVAVGATNSLDQRAPFSNYGWFLDLAAPGVDILSLRAAGTSRGFVQDAFTTVLSGTSMACPYAAGVAGLALLRNPGFNLDQLRSALKLPSDTLSSPLYIGQGRINANGVAGITQPPPVANLNMFYDRFDQQRVGGSIRLDGTANGANFHHYELSFGAGTAATTWTPITSSTASVSRDVLAWFDTSLPWRGFHSVRLVAVDAAGGRVEDQQLILAENFVPLSPANNDVLRLDDAVAIKALLRASNSTVQVEHGLGINPQTWSSAGIISAPGPDNQWATWDTKPLRAATFASLRFTITTPHGVQTEYSDMFFLEPKLRPGFPVRIPHHADATWYADFQDFAVDDLDGDGQKEILAVATDPIYFATRLDCYSNTGELRWSYYPAGPLGYPGIPCIGDINKDGKKEIFISFDEQRRIYGIRHDGTALPGWPAVTPGNGAQCTIADLDRDGVMELIAIAKPGPRSLTIFSPTGTIIRQTNLQAENWSTEPTAFPAVGQFDADADLEICINHGQGRVAVYNKHGTLVPGWPVSAGGQAVMGVTVGDVDNDGFDEVAVANQEDPAGSSAGVRLYNRFGQEMPGWPVLAGPVSHWHFNPVPMADLDGDGDLELIVSNMSRLYVYHHDGSLAPGWPVVTTYAAMHRPPVIGDVDGDGKPDIVVAAGGLQPGGNNSLFSPEQSRGLQAWNFQGQQIDLSPLPNIQTLFMEHGMHSARWKAPAVLTDLDGNGTLDILASAVSEVAFSSGRTYSRDKKRNSIYAWELPVPYRTETMLWPQFANNTARQNRHQTPNATRVADWALY